MLVIACFFIIYNGSLIAYKNKYRDLVLLILKIKHAFIFMHIYAEHQSDAQIQRNNRCSAGAEEGQCYSYNRQQRKTHAYIYHGLHCYHGKYADAYHAAHFVSRHI